MRITLPTQDLLDLSCPPMEAPEIKPNTVFHVGISGGKDSTAVLLWMIHDGKSR